MKFAALALLSSGGVLADTMKAAPKKDDLSAMKKEDWENWGKLFFEAQEKFFELPEKSKMRREWKKTIRGDNMKEMKGMQKFIYAKDGPWDQHAGDDHMMTLDEARKFDVDFRAELAKHHVKGIPQMDDAYWKRAYAAYNALSTGEGFTKADARKADRIMNAIRKWAVNWRPSKEQVQAFRPVWKREMKRWDSLDEDSKLYKMTQKWLNHRLDRKMHLANKEIFKDGGAFDKMAGEDHSMNLEEAKKFNDMMRAGMKKKTGLDIPAYSDADFKAMFDAYDSLSKGDGFTKADALTGGMIVNKFRDWKITDQEIDFFWPMADQYYYDYIDELDDDSKVKKMWMNFVENGMDKKMHKMWKAMFKKFDKNHNGALGRKEFGAVRKEYLKMTEKMFGKDEVEDFSRGQMKFFWLMMQQVQKFPWNEYGRHRHGVSMADHNRLARILRKIYKEILEDEKEDSDDDSESSDDENKDDGKEDFDEEDNEFLLI